MKYRTLAFVKDNVLHEFFMQYIRGHLTEIEIPTNSTELDPGILAEAFWALKKDAITVAVSGTDYEIIKTAAERLGVSKRLLAVYITIQEMRKFYAEVQE